MRMQITKRWRKATGEELREAVRQIFMNASSLRGRAYHSTGFDVYVCARKVKVAPTECVIYSLYLHTIYQSSIISSRLGPCSYFHIGPKWKMLQLQLWCIDQETYLYSHPRWGPNSRYWKCCCCCCCSLDQWYQAPAVPCFSLFASHTTSSLTI